MYHPTRREFIRNAMAIGGGLTVGASAVSNIHAAETIAHPKGDGLLLPPFLGCPNRTTIKMNIVGDASAIRCSVAYREKQGDNSRRWQRLEDVPVQAYAAKELVFQALQPETSYEYQILKITDQPTPGHILADGEFATQKSSAAPFAFVLFSDSHITPQHKDRLKTLSEVCRSVRSRKPDFGIMLGDNIQTFTSHGGPMTDPRFGPLLYSTLRNGLGTLPSEVPLFYVNGNWEGENGWHPEREKEWARSARRGFIPSTNTYTYPQGGSENGDYYAFEWGNALFVVLNVTGYTPTDHRHTVGPGKADEWTLGEAQRNWLLRTLKNSDARWKMIFIHHTVGGNAGDDINSRYGRGGGRAAHVGEQDLIHQWMIKYGVQALFYGHDHVFTDIPVDGIHYICVGSAGAPWKFDTGVTGYNNYLTPSGYTWVSVNSNNVEVSYIQPKVEKIEGKTLHRLLLT